MRTVPNVALAREASNPKVYLVVGDSRLWINSPAEFESLGFQWSKVLVVEDGSLSDLIEKPLQAGPPTHPSSVFFDCGDDYDAVDGKHYRNCQHSSHCVHRLGETHTDVLLAGWLDNLPESPNVNVKPHGVEDVHYDLHLDWNFLDRMYGPDGLSNRLAGAQLWGNPSSTVPMPFADGPVITPNSWLLPPNPSLRLHNELNAWHQSTSGGLFTGHFDGRGPAPAGWVNPLDEDLDAWFPFDVLNPDGATHRLHSGVYVILRGPLWQDHGHPPGDPFGGWLEMHPIDWVVRVAGPPPDARRTVGAAHGGASMTDGTVPVGVSIFPDFEVAYAQIEPRAVQEFVDHRWTVPASVGPISVVMSRDHVDVTVPVTATSGQDGFLKGCWVVDWRTCMDNDHVWVDDHLPKGAQQFGDGEDWDWVTADPAPYSGARAHRSALTGGLHQHYFLGATGPMVVGRRDVLFAMVWLDPASPPDEVMLQWHAGSWEHRATWGADVIDWGAPGSASRQSMGRLPFSGEWVRLQVPAADVGLAGGTVDGMAFTLSGGRAAWDRAGVLRRLPELELGVSPAMITAGVNTAVTLKSQDANTGEKVPGTIYYGPTAVGSTGVAFWRTFLAGRAYTFVVRSPGYADASIDLVAEPQEI